MLRIVRGGADGLVLEALTPARLAADLEPGGAVVYRGLEVSPTDFLALARRHSRHLLVDPSPDRTPHASVPELQTVVAGQADVALHFEYGHTPFRPERLWLYCEEPPATGGETTVCDGVALWRELDERLRQRLRGEELTYVGRIPERAWRAFLRIDAKVPMTAAVRQAKVVLAEVAGLAPRFTPEGELHWRLRAAWAAARGTSESLGWIADVHPEAHDDSQAFLADLRPVPSEWLEELGRAAAKVTEAHGWERGDVLVLDNRRSLHGRRAFADARRSIYTLCSMA